MSNKKFPTEMRGKTKDIRECNCCNRINGEVFVASSTLGGVSFAYCRDCLSNGAEPYSMLEGTYEMLGNDMADWALDLKYWNSNSKQYETFRSSLPSS